jgi:hypothetical protein
VIVEMEPGVPGASGLDYILEEITWDITAVDGKMYLVDCSAGDVTITIWTDIINLGIKKMDDSEFKIILDTGAGLIDLESGPFEILFKNTTYFLKKNGVNFIKF